MAEVYYSATSGNWSVVANWVTGATPSPYGKLPQSDDDVYANGKTININQNITVKSLNTTIGTTSPPVAGGVFNVTNDNITIISNNIRPGTTTCVSSSIVVGQVLNIIGNISGGSATNVFGVNNSSTGALYITGNTTGGTSSSVTPAVNNASSGIVDIFGDCYAGTGYPALYSSTQTSINIIRGNLINRNGISAYYTYNLEVSPTLNQNFTLQDTTVVSANTVFSTSSTTFGYNYVTPFKTDVRNGVKFGLNSGDTGTIIIPPLSAVSLGVYVDNGSGTTTFGNAIIRLTEAGALYTAYLI